MTHESESLSHGLRVLLVEDNTLVGMGVKSQLAKLGHTTVGQAARSDRAVELFRSEKPDLVIVDIRLDGSDGIEVAWMLLQERRVPMIILSAYSDPQLIDRASQSGVFGYLIKPASTESLHAQIQIAVTRFAEHEKLLLEKEALSHTLETRKLVERAKGILMRRANLNEDEAHRRLQQESQKRRIGLAEIAKKIIESEELLGGS